MSPEMRQALELIKTKGDFSLLNQADEMWALRAARTGQLKPQVEGEGRFVIRRFINSPKLTELGQGKVVAIEWNMPCPSCKRIADQGVKYNLGPVNCTACGDSGWQLVEAVYTDLHGEVVELDEL